MRDISKIRERSLETKNLPEEIKKKAVAEVLEKGRVATHVAKELGLRYNSVVGLVRAARRKNKKNHGKRYDEAFKVSAVKQVKENNWDMKTAEKKTGVNIKTLSTWVYQVGGKFGKKATKKGHYKKEEPYGRVIDNTPKFTGSFVNDFSIPTKTTLAKSAFKSDPAMASVKAMATELQQFIQSNFGGSILTTQAIKRLDEMNEILSTLQKV